MVTFAPRLVRVHVMLYNEPWLNVVAFVGDVRTIELSVEGRSVSYFQGSEDGVSCQTLDNMKSIHANIFKQT